MKHTSQVGVSCLSCEAKLKEADPFLADWFHRAKVLFPDIHVSWSFRDQAAQQLAFTSGKSKLPWPRSKHNQMPSQAIDLFQIDHNGHAIFDPVLMAKVFNTFPRGVRWGGTFAIRDNDHFELLENKPNSAS